MSRPGTSWMPCARNTAPAVTPISATGASQDAVVDTVGPLASACGLQSTIVSPENRQSAIRTWCACCVPIHATSSRLAPSAPTIAPQVLAAYTLPTRTPASCPGAATAASASGKLAPHRIAAGSTAQKQRTRSSCIVYHGLVEIDGLIGQYGSESVSMKEVHAIAAH